MRSPLARQVSAHARPTPGRAAFLARGRSVVGHAPEPPGVVPRDQCNIADTAWQYCLGSRSRPRVGSGAASVCDASVDCAPRAPAVRWGRAH